ncbi:MAG TPA: SDR family NAD(P)-dependent oxidoreductase [Acidimicrobiales bacterium]|nr:SDR family NAD(P)-dependent oxidoreductase [Acidimicrobiales bacterium]
MNDVTGMPQTVVVLGGSSDLAHAVLRRLALRRLETLVLAGRDRSSLSAAAEQFRRLGVHVAEAVHFDALETGRHESFAEDVASRFGALDLVLVATGVLGTGDLAVLDAAQVAGSIETNFSGPAAALIAFAKIMRRQGHGQIVVLSSFAGVRIRRQNFVYGSAKAGLDGFSQGLADVLAGSGVRVMIVRPGFVATKMTAGAAPLPFAVSADDVAAAVVRGLERRADVVWVPGILRLVGAAARCVPRWLWRRLPG